LADVALPLAGFKCKVGDERLTLADLDPDAASAVRMAALPGLAEQATTTAGAQALLDTADLVDPLPDDEAASLGRLFAVALTKLLENSRVRCLRNIQKRSKQVS
jgi:hypothetical protein